VQTMLLNLQETPTTKQSFTSMPPSRHTVDSGTHLHNHAHKNLNLKP